MPHPSKKFRQNPFTTLFQLSDGQRDKQTEVKTPHTVYIARWTVYLSAETVTYLDIYCRFETKALPLNRKTKPPSVCKAKL